MNLIRLSLTSALGILTALAAATTASAQCGGPAHHVAYSTTAPGKASFRLAQFSPRSEDRWGEERDEYGMEPIVGLWHIDMEDPSKGYSDHGYTAWHADHTEFFNSTRAPGTGAVCQGVWEKIGRSTYQLNHFALAYNGSVAPDNMGNTTPNEAAPAQIVHIREVVTVDPSRKHFKGQFIVEVFTYAGHNLLVTFRGPITADRITIDTPISTQ